MANHLRLSEGDKLILSSYELMLDGLGKFLGKSNEIVLHSLENYEHAAIKVINGHFSNRKEGAPITDMALTMLDQLKSQQGYSIDPYYNKNKNGAILKSATIPVVGEHKRIIGLICINMHLESSVIDFISDLIPNFNETPAYSGLKNSENFSSNVDELIETALEKAKETVEQDVMISPSNHNKEIVTQLYHQGIFKLKDSVIKVAKLLGISKNTIYLHLRNCKKG